MTRFTITRSTTRPTTTTPTTAPAPHSSSSAAPAPPVHQTIFLPWDVNPFTHVRVESNGRPLTDAQRGFTDSRIVGQRLPSRIPVPGFRRTSAVIEADLRREARWQARNPSAGYARELPLRQEPWTDTSSRGRRNPPKPRQPHLATYRAAGPSGFAAAASARLAPEQVWTRAWAAAPGPEPVVPTKGRFVPTPRGAWSAQRAAEAARAARPAPVAAGPPASAPVAPATTAARADAQLAEILAPLSKAERYSAAMLALKRVRRTAGGDALVRGAVADTVAARVAPAQLAARGGDSAAPASAPALKRKRETGGDETGPAKKRAVGGRE